ncbi:insulinase family protein [bacterium]|nr:insulinase family protein [bacterium]
MFRKAITTPLLLLLLLSSRLPSSPTGDVEHTMLENGLTVIVIENPTVPLVTIEIDVRNGAFTEPPELDGLSHLFEHMFFKANQSIPSQEKFLERTRELGMHFNATTSEERVSYSFTVPRDSLRPGMQFMKAAIATPLFLKEELERERLVVIDEYDRNESDPMFHLNRAVNRRLWFEYFSRKNTIGDREIILTATPSTMHAIQEKYYIPNNSALLVAGNVKHKEVFELARQYFSDWQRGPDPFFDDPIPYHPTLAKSDTVIVEQDVNVVTIMLRWQGPSVSINTEATYAADVFSFMMNQGSKFRRILVSSGLFSSVSLSYLTLDQKGPITIVAQTPPDKFLRAKRALFEEMKFLLHSDYFTNEEIEFAKTRLEIQEIYSQERPSSYVRSVGYWWSVTGGLDYYFNYIDNLKKVTRQDIIDFVTKYMQEAPYVLGILVSPEDKEKLDLYSLN